MMYSLHHLDTFADAKVQAKIKAGMLDHASQILRVAEYGYT